MNIPDFAVNYPDEETCRKKFNPNYAIEKKITFKVKNPNA
jgi:hypothetical protein